MSDNGHTPGPWHVQHWNVNGSIDIKAPAHTRVIEPPGVLCRVYPASVLIGGVHCGHTEREIARTTSDARLIGAVPNLLGACMAMDEWYDLVKQNYPEMLRSYLAVRAAVALATNEGYTGADKNEQSHSDGVD